MCGIFGICLYNSRCTYRQLAGQLISGLKRLEYRGYDSAGFSIETADNKRKIVKKKGNVQVLRETVFGTAEEQKENQNFKSPLDLDDFAGNVGIAHTRWATHGPPSDCNAHPHTSDDENSFVVIHNGIMTNFTEMKQFLEQHGYKHYSSDTDTEVISKLALHLYQSHLQKAGGNKDAIKFVEIMAEVFKLVEGANAMIVMSRFYPGEIVVMKRGSPMICGFQRVDEDGNAIGGGGSKGGMGRQDSLTEIPQSPSPASAASAAAGGGVGNNNNNTNNTPPRNQFTASSASHNKPIEHARMQSGDNPFSRRALPEVKTVDHAKQISGEGKVSFDNSPCRMYFSSDPAAIAEHTKQVVYLDDNDLVHFSPEGGGSLAFYKLEGSLQQAVGRNISELEMELESLSKAGYPHFMLKEIFEQVNSVVNTMRGRINFADASVRLGGFLPKPNRSALLSARRIMFIACGTSLNACIAVRPLFDELAGCPTAIENASDFLDRMPKIFRDDVCFFVSQSGETADVLRALEYCRESGAVLVGMTNTVGSSISRLSHFGAHLNCGPEIGVASTKAFSSQVVTLMMIALMLCDDSIAHSERRLDILRGLEKLSGHIDETLRMCEETVKKVAASFIAAKSLLIIGRGYQFATCLEAALKVKELSYIHTEGINAGELKHGPLALIDENIPVIIICTKDRLVERSRAAVQQIRARKGKPIVVLSDPDPEVESLAEVVIRVPRTVDCLQVLINAIPMQLLAYHVAVLRGNNVDCPRNLAKSVTVQ